MRHAPPVSVLCHGREWRWAQAGVFGLATAALCAWAAQHAELTGWAVALVAATGSTVGVALALRLLRTPVQGLCWNGQQWLVADRPAQVDLMLQGGRFVLLRWRAESGAVAWLAVGRAEAASAWHGLLVALRAGSTPVDLTTQGQGG